jgi:hypothetical protein
MPQVPPVQEAVPLAVLHTFPHVPQFDVVFTSVSHPFATFPSQFANPALHAIVQPVGPQPGTPLFELQLLPHVPQFVVVVMLVSQPFATLLSQSA